MNKYQKVRKLSILFFLGFIIQFMYSQDYNYRLKIIDSCFNEIKKGSGLDTTVYKQSLSYLPFYESSAYLNWKNNEKIMAGGFCHQYGYSKKMRLYSIITAMFYGANKDECYRLVNETNEVLYDLEIFNCSGMKVSLVLNKNGFPTTAIKRINQSLMSELSDSYQEWYNALKKEGLSTLIKKDISPLHNTNFRWRQEIGYIENKKNFYEIVDIGKRILNNNDYINTFTVENQLKENTSEADREIIAKLLLLSIINNNYQYSFTSNILDFDIQYPNGTALSLWELLIPDINKANNPNFFNLNKWVKDNQVEIKLKSK